MIGKQKCVRPFFLPALLSGFSSRTPNLLTGFYKLGTLGLNGKKTIKQLEAPRKYCYSLFMK